MMRRLSVLITIVTLSMLLIPYYASATSIIKEWDFSNRSTLNGWRTNYIWEMNNSPKGTIEWSPSFGGSIHLSVSGAPCVVNLWNVLPFDLEWGDVLRLEFSTYSYLHPISGFDLIIGPAEPYGHKQSIQVSVDRAGTYSVDLGIYYYWAVAGTAFGVNFAVWPGTAELYIKKIMILR